MKKQKIYIYIFDYFCNCFKIMYVCKIEGKNKITDFFEHCHFHQFTQVLSHQFSQRLARGLRPNNGVVQRGNTTGTTIGKHNGEKTRRNNREKRKVKKNKKTYFLFYLVALI